MNNKDFNALPTEATLPYGAITDAPDALTTDGDGQRKQRQRKV